MKTKLLAVPALLAASLALSWSIPMLASASKMKPSANVVDSDWMFKENRDELSGEKSYQAFVTSYDGSATLFYTCLFSGVMYDTYMGSQQSLDVHYRIDELGVFETQGYSIHGNGKVVMRFFDHIADAMLRVGGKKKVVVRTFNSRGTPTTNTFSLKGSSETLAKLDKNCPAE